MRFTLNENAIIIKFYATKYTIVFPTHISSELSIEKKQWKYTRQVVCALYLINPHFGFRQLNINLINSKIIRLRTSMELAINMSHAQ